MEKIDLNQQFAQRLKDAMIAAGFNSARSTSGVCIHKLVEITGYSTQICRKYLRGEAIPEPSKLVVIARHLKVSPGWLLFGDAQDEGPLSAARISISKALLHYIFMHARALCNAASDDQEVADFMMALVDDVSHIDASEAQLKKIISLAFSSVHHFNQRQAGSA